MILTAKSSTAWIHEKPIEDNILRDGDSELLYGELFHVEKQDGAWVYGTSASDGYKGWVKQSALWDVLTDATHTVSVRQSHLYSAPSGKTRPVIALSFMSRLSMSAEIKNGFQKTADGLWIDASHISLIHSTPLCDVAQTALLLNGTPYLYGGRSAFGIDCSGLIGMALQRHNIQTRRDSLQIAQDVGVDIPLNSPLERNDIIYLEGHIGIMLDDTHFLNATMRHMTTLIENIKEIAPLYKGGILKIKRLV